MKTKEHKILVLSDLKATANSTLKSAVSLAKILHANINFFYVKEANDVVEVQNQLSAVRTINSTFLSIEKEIKSLVRTLSQDQDISINYHHAIGNIKHEIARHIENLQPDIIILGKKESNPLKLIGDDITSFIFKQYSGTVIIINNEDNFSDLNALNIGFLNSNTAFYKHNIVTALLEKTEQSIKSFNIGKKTNSSFPLEDKAPIKTITYTFENNSNIIKTITSYISKNNINLLCMDRNNPENKYFTNNLKKLSKQINTALLIINS